MRTSEPAEDLYGCEVASTAERPANAATNARHRPRVARTAATLLWGTVQQAWHDRILGLAAEAGFWQLLSLPSLILAVLGVLGYFSGLLGADNVNDLQSTIDGALKHVIVPSAVNSTVAPALHRILYGGRADVVSISFVVSLWTGSSAMATYVNTITIAYGMRQLRGAVSSRLLALRLYLSFVFISIVLLPLLVLGPAHFVALFPKGSRHALRDVTNVGYWPVVVLLSFALLATLYHRAVPVRMAWRRALPGAVVGVVVWTVGSLLL